MIIVSEETKQRIADFVARAADEAMERIKHNREKISRVNQSFSLKASSKRRRSFLAEIERLEFDTQQNGYQAFLKHCGSTAWLKLTPEKRWEKGNVLSMLYGRGSPSAFDAAWFDDAPESILADRDVIIARLDRGDSLFKRSPIPLQIPQQLPIPEQFLNDKEVMIAAVRKYPTTIKQENIPDWIFDEEDAFLACSRSGVICSWYPELFSKFTARIRGICPLMLEACKKTHAVYGFLDRSLQADSLFAIRLADGAAPEKSIFERQKLPDNALTYFSDAVRSNPGVVRAFVSKNGMCLRDAIMELRGNEELVRTACAQNPEAILCCPPGPTRSLLGADRAFMLHLLAHGFIHKRLYNIVSSDLKFDREIIVKARETNNIKISDLPPALATDRDFWLDIIKSAPCFWLDLPLEFQDDVLFARAIERFSSRKLIEALMGRFPFLSHDREFWANIVGSLSRTNSAGCLFTEAIDYASIDIKGDDELMLRAFSQRPFIYEYLPIRLQEDRRFLEQLVEINPDPLLSMPHHCQRLHPDLVLKGMHTGEQVEYLEEIVDYVAPEVWRELAVWKKYIKDGGNYFAHLSDEMKDDVEFGLFAAEHLPQQDDYCSIMFAEATSVALRSNRSFMEKAVRFHGYHFLDASDDLLQDCNLALIAFSCDNQGLRVVKHIEELKGGVSAPCVEPRKRHNMLLRRIWCWDTMWNVNV